MANCINCRKDVGCSCNLFNGLCMSCYGVKERTSSNTVTYSNPDAEPVSGFTEIVNDTSLSQEEKVKRINDILEQARQKLI